MSTSPSRRAPRASPAHLPDRGDLDGGAGIRVARRGHTMIWRQFGNPALTPRYRSVDTASAA
ncbi:MAG: hypothetical protein ABIT20_21740 [Gemmatimonadaceae bacterium]